MVMDISPLVWESLSPSLHVNELYLIMYEKLVYEVLPIEIDEEDVYGMVLYRKVGDDREEILYDRMDDEGEGEERMIEFMPWDVVVVRVQMQERGEDE